MNSIKEISKCPECPLFPLIKIISSEKITIKCIKNHNKEMNIIDYYNNQINLKCIYCEEEKFDY